MPRPFARRAHNSKRAAFARSSTGTISMPWARIGKPDVASPLLEEAERKFGPKVRGSDLVQEHVLIYDRWWREEVAETWRLAGRPARARRTLLNESEDVVHPDLLDSLIRLNDPADVPGIAKAVDALLASLKLPSADGEAEFLSVVQAFADVGNLDQASAWRMRAPRDLYGTKPSRKSPSRRRGSGTRFRMHSSSIAQSS
jgi:hypothetical protein